MKTITFYSYKGGVGRTLTLSNIAIRLSELGKKVCLLDFDLEAPGLHFKFKNNKLKIDKGLVDYIYEYSVYGIIPDKIGNYSLSIAPLNSNFRQIDLIPAGNIQSDEYWKKMSMIDWSKMFYSEHGHGVRFILDLKAKIEKELNPDVLLIDSRTGITDISGITLKLLADEVVILSSYNDEGLFGSKKIISNLLDNKNTLFGNTPKIHFVLTRIPFNSKSVYEIAKENRIIKIVKSEMLKSLVLKDLDISIIRSDRSLEENERQMIGYELEMENIPISNDYLKLFDKITFDILSTEEIILFKNKKNAEKEFIKSQNEKDNPKKIELLNKAIELNPTNWEYFFSRGYAYAELLEYNKAIQEFIKSLELNPQNEKTIYNLSYCYGKINEYDKAILYAKKAIEINPTFNSYTILSIYLKKTNEYAKALDVLNQGIINDEKNDNLYNSRADIYRSLGEFDKAYSDIYKAIEINSQNPIYFGTLAEIFASTGKIEEFYFNLNIALGMGMNAESMSSAKDVYEKFKDEERFKNLLNKYGIDIEEVFQN